jgi:hypothetical protein
MSVTASAPTATKPLQANSTLTFKLDGGSDPDPLDSTFRFFGQPRSKAAIAIPLGVSATFGTLAALFSRLNGLGGPATAGISLGAGAVGAVGGAAFALMTPGPSVGHTDGQVSVFHQTGTESYQTNCTVTSTTTGPDNNHDGIADTSTTTSTVPCTKTRPTGFYQGVDATGTFTLGSTKGDKAGYESLEAAQKAVSGTAVFVEHDNRVFAFTPKTLGIDAIKQYVPTNSHVLAVQ